MHLDPVWEEEALTPHGKSPAKLFETMEMQGPVHRYLGYSQNDTMVLGCEITRDSFSLTFNHHDIWQLALVFRDDRKCGQSLRRAFPVKLTFAGLSELVAVRFVEQGAMMKLRNSLKNVASALYDIRFISCIDSRPPDLRFLIAARGRTPFRRRPKLFANPFEDSYYFALTCRDVTVTDGTRAGWIKHLGAQSLPLLDKFESVWPVPLYGAPDFEAWIEESRELVS